VLPARTLPVLALSALLLAGCGSSDEAPVAAATTAGTPPASASGSPSPTAVPLAEQEPEEILAAAKRALSDARSVRLRGEFVEDGEKVGVDLAIKESQGARGTITALGVTFDLVRVGKQVFIRPPESFYRKQGGAQAVALLGGKYLKTSVKDKDFADLVSFTSLDALDELLTPTGELTRTKVRTVAGQEVVGLVDSDEGGVLYVATTGSPLPVQLAAEEPGASDQDSSASGKLDFLDYDEPVDLQVPEDVIDPKAFGR